MLQLRACRHERGAIDGSPTLVLRIGKFDPTRVEILGKLDDRLDPVEVVPVEHDVDRQRKTELRASFAASIFLENERVPPIRSDEIGSLS